MKLHQSYYINYSKKILVYTAGHKKRNTGYIFALFPLLAQIILFLVGYYLPSINYSAI